MMRNTLLSALAVGALLFTTGCDSEECVDAFDCDEGFVCRDGACTEGSPTTDSGTQTDAGTEEDAGTQTDAGQTDAGSETDAGTPSCATNADCTGPFWCSVQGDAGTCEPLHIGVTQVVDAGVVATSQAVLVPFNDAAAASRTNLGTVGSKTPRFNPTGTVVTYVQKPAVGTVELRRAVIPFTSTSLVATGTDAGTSDFAQLTFAPGPAPAWVKTSTTGDLGGLQFIRTPTDGGAPFVETAGTSAGSVGIQPDWVGPLGLMHTEPGTGIFGYIVNSFPMAPPAGANFPFTDNVNDHTPRVGPTGEFMLWLRNDPSAAFPEHSDDLWLLNILSMSPQPIHVYTAVPAVGQSTDGGTPGSYAASPSWGPTDGLFAYVVVSYYLDANNEPQLCTPATCNGAEGQQVVLQRFTPGDPGALAGSAIEVAAGTNPALSPAGSGNWVAYVGSTGTTLNVVQYDLDGGTFNPGTSFTHTFAAPLNRDQNEGRPVWQPKLPPMGP